MFLILVLGLARCILCQDLTISMPGVVTPGPEMYMCTSIKVPKETHIIGFETLAASESNIHHMLLHGCSSPGSSSDPVWQCRHDRRGVGNFSHAPVCGGGQSAGMAFRVLYGWLRNTDPLKLPDGVGFTVGVDGIDYLVLQVSDIFLFWFHLLCSGFSISFLVSPIPLDVCDFSTHFSYLARYKWTNRLCQWMKIHLGGQCVCSY